MPSPTVRSPLTVNVPAPKTCALDEEGIKPKLLYVVAGILLAPLPVKFTVLPVTVKVLEPDKTNGLEVPVKVIVSEEISKF